MAGPATLPPMSPPTRGSRDREAHRHPRRRLQRGVDPGPGARPHPGRVPAAHRRGPRRRRRQRRRHLPGRPRLPAARRPTCRSRSSAIRATSATAATRRPATAGRSSTTSTSSCCSTATGSTRRRCCPTIVAPLERGEADAVFGSRMMDAGRARAGRHAALQVRRQPDPHPFENAVAGHGPDASGTPATAPTRVDALRDDPVRAQLRRLRLRHRDHPAAHEAGKRIAEIPIPTYYGDEICYVNGIELRPRRHRATSPATAPHKMGFGTGELAFATDDYELKDGADTSRTASCSAWLGDAAAVAGARPRLLRRPARRAAARARATTSPASTSSQTTAWASGSTEFVEADLDQGIPRRGRRRLTTSIAGRRRARARARARRRARPRPAICWRPAASLIVSVPNFGHWYPRLRVAVGPVRLRPPRHPRPRPRALLHPAAASSASSTAHRLRGGSLSTAPGCRSRSSTRRPARRRPVGGPARLRRRRRPRSASRSGRSCSPTSSSTSCAPDRRLSPPRAATRPRGHQTSGTWPSG